MTSRDTQGRFVTGHPGGPGRLRRATEQTYMAVLMESCPPERWRGIVQRAIEAAEDGDDKARHWLAAYLIGRPGVNAPTPTAVLIERMVGGDAVLAKAAAILAKPIVDAEMWPILNRDAERQRVIEAEMAEVLAAEDQPFTAEG